MSDRDEYASRLAGAIWCGLAVAEGRAPERVEAACLELVDDKDFDLVAEALGTDSFGWRLNQPEAKRNGPLAGAVGPAVKSQAGYASNSSVAAASSQERIRVYVDEPTMERAMWEAIVAAAIKPLLDDVGRLLTAESARSRHYREHAEKAEAERDALVKLYLAAIDRAEAALIAAHRALTTHSTEGEPQ